MRGRRDHEILFPTLTYSQISSVEKNRHCGECILFIHCRGVAYFLRCSGFSPAKKMVVCILFSFSWFIYLISGLLWRYQELFSGFFASRSHIPSSASFLFLLAGDCLHSGTCCLIP